MKSRIVLGALVVLVLLATGRTVRLYAEDKEVQAPPDPQKIRQQIEAVDQQIADLQEKKEALDLAAADAERLADRLNELKELRKESQERLRDADKELGEIARNAPPETADGVALRDGHSKFLRDRIALDQELSAIDNPAMLEQARVLRDKVDDLGHEWWLVLQPRLAGAAVIARMTDHLREAHSRANAERLEQYKRLVEERVAAGQRELDLRRARRANEQALDGLRKEFWGER